MQPGSHFAQIRKIVKSKTALVHPNPKNFSISQETTSQIDKIKYVLENVSNTSSCF